MSQRGPNAIDRAIAVVSPERALRRLQARAAFEAASGLLLGSGGYQGARTDKRSLRHWLPGARSADADLVPDLEKLRARSRDLIRNTPLAGGAVNNVVTSVVGPGLTHQSTIDRELLGLDEPAAALWETRAERLFTLFCRECDITRSQHFEDVQDTVLRSQLGSGDILVFRRFPARRRGELFGTKLQMVEADRVCTPMGQENDPKIVDGVELDGVGAPSRFWVRNRHEHDLHFQPERDRWVPVRAFNRNTGERTALLIFDRRRPGQTRGEPYLAPVIEPLKQLGRYTDAELAAAVISSFYTVFVKTVTGDGIANQTSDMGPSEETGDPTHPSRDLKLDQAAVLDLGPDEDITIANPMRPNGAFDPFVTAMARQIGVALEQPFEVMLKHFSASYSASRAALLEAWRFYLKRRAFLIRYLGDPVYEWAISEAVARGLLTAPGFFSDPLIRRAYLKSTWWGPAQGHVQPLQEIRAVTKALDAGLMSPQEATATTTGGNWESVVRQRQRAKAILEESGLQPVVTDVAEEETDSPQDVQDRGE